MLIMLQVLPVGALNANIDVACDTGLNSIGYLATVAARQFRLHSVLDHAEGVSLRILQLQRVVAALEANFEVVLILGALHDGHLILVLAESTLDIATVEDKEVLELALDLLNIVAGQAYCVVIFLARPKGVFPLLTTIVADHLGSLLLHHVTVQTSWQVLEFIRAAILTDEVLAAIFGARVEHLVFGGVCLALGATAEVPIVESFRVEFQRLTLGALNLLYFAVLLFVSLNLITRGSLGELAR